MFNTPCGRLIRRVNYWQDSLSFCATLPRYMKIWVPQPPSNIHEIDLCHPANLNFVQQNFSFSGFDFSCSTSRVNTRSSTDSARGTESLTKARSVILMFPTNWSTTLPNIYSSCKCWKVIEQRHIFASHLNQHEKVRNGLATLQSTPSFFQSKGLSSDR